MNQRLLALICILLLSPAAVFAGGTDQRQIAWSDLSAILTKNVRIVMPDGTRISGKALSVETDALAVEVTKTSNKNAYPQGRLLVPRATLKAFDVSHATYHWRIIGLCLGAAAGLVAAAGIAAATNGTVGRENNAGAYIVGGAVPVAGLFLGQAADQRITTYVVTQ